MFIHGSFDILGEENSEHHVQPLPIPLSQLLSHESPSSILSYLKSQGEPDRQPYTLFHLQYDFCTGDKAGITFHRRRCLPLYSSIETTLPTLWGWRLRVSYLRCVPFHQF